MISWSSTQRAVRWCALDWLHKTTAPEIYEVDKILPELFGHAIDPVDLTASSASDRTWFSSLWTLQEACLQPSMILVNYNWDPLVDDSGTYIMLDNLLGIGHTKDSYGWTDTCSESLIVNPLDQMWFDQAVSPIYGKACTRPLGAQQLYDLYHGHHGTGLVTQPSPTGILAMGSHRHSQSSADRPRAVQSVLGLTNWTRNVPEMEKDIIVLGLYPLPFVRSASQSIGPMFYSSDMRLTPGDYNGVKDPWRAGSMMCFTEPGHAVRLTSLPYHHWDADAGSVDCPAASTWTINGNASVRIERAAILASHEGVMMYSESFHELARFLVWTEAEAAPEARRISVFLKVANDRGRIDAFSCDDIRSFLQEYPSEIKTYLVAISLIPPKHPDDDHGPMHHGIVVQGTDYRCLRKIGTYMISGHKEASSFPLIQEVDWMIL